MLKLLSKYSSLFLNIFFTFFTGIAFFFCFFLFAMVGDSPLVQTHSMLWSGVMLLSVTIWLAIGMYFFVTWLTLYRAGKYGLSVIASMSSLMPYFFLILSEIIFPAGDLWGGVSTAFTWVASSILLPSLCAYMFHDMFMRQPVPRKRKR